MIAIFCIYGRTGIVLFLSRSSETNAHAKQDLYHSKQYHFCPHDATINTKWKFLCGSFILWSLKIFLESAHRNFSNPKVTSTSVMLSWTKSLKPKNIHFAMTYAKEKQQRQIWKLGSENDDALLKRQLVHCQNLADHFSIYLSALLIT